MGMGMGVRVRERWWGGEGQVEGRWGGQAVHEHHLSCMVAWTVAPVHRFACEVYCRLSGVLQPIGYEVCYSLYVMRSATAYRL